MALDKQKLAKLIQKEWADDYFRFELISTPIEVVEVAQTENTLKVTYTFWDDYHHVTDDPNNFLFDLDLGNEYGVNFPSGLNFCKVEGLLTWNTKLDCDNLSSDLVSEEVIEVDTNYEDWDSQLISDSLIEDFISRVDKDSMVEMLKNEYQAEISLPNFIPERLRPYFQKMLDDEIKMQENKK
jgi:hypothetical protein